MPRTPFVAGIALAFAFAPAPPTALARQPITDPPGGRTKVLGVPETPGVTLFDDLVRLHVERSLSGRIPEAPDGEPLRSSVYVTLTVEAAWMWDKPIVRFERGLFPRASLAACPKACSIPLRDAAMGALIEHDEYLNAAGLDFGPRFLVVADAELPAETLLLALRSLASASSGAPAGMDLLYRTPRGLRSVPVYIPPPDPIPIRAAASPLLADIQITAKGWEARATHVYLPQPVTVSAEPALLSFIGDLRSRDPAKRVAFVSAPDRVTVREVARLVELVHREYPVVVLKPPGPIATRISERAR